MKTTIIIPNYNGIEYSFAYDNGIYTFFIYEFSDLYNYNSLELKDIKRYIINNKSSDEIKQEIVTKVETINDLPQSEIPFPQADSFNRIIGIADLVDSKINTAVDIAEEYEFDVRQGSYYLAAAKYLDIVDKKRFIYESLFKYIKIWI